MTYGCAFAALLEIQTASERLLRQRSSDARRRRVPLRIGLNSGQVIAGEIGSEPSGLHHRSASKWEWPSAWNRLPRQVE